MENMTSSRNHKAVLSFRGERVDFLVKIWNINLSNLEDKYAVFR